MKAEIKGRGEKRTRTVNKGGTVYISKDLAGKDVEIAYEVIDSETQE